MFHPQSKSDPYFRKALYQVYGGKCAYCGDPIVAPGNLHVDHIYAENARAAEDPELRAYLDELRANGFPVNQPDVIENYLPACQKCNRQKSNWNFTARNLRYYHNLALRYTQDILDKLEKYHRREPDDLDDFRVENMAVRYLTDPPGKADSSNVICRDKELEDIVGQLRAGKSVLLMSGFGGIGKTALAKLVFHTVEAEYDAVAWIDYRGNLKNSLLAEILLENDIRDEPERWRRIQAILGDGRKKLFVIDNADHSEGQNPQEDAELLRLTGRENISVIVTSRLDELESYQKKEIGFLSPDACVELFYLYYPNDPERVQHAVVEKLVELAQYHSLTVELFAKGAKRKADLESYYQTLSKDLRAATRQFATGHTGKMGTIEAHLRGLFIVQDRTDAEKHTLWSFAVLPPNAALSVEEAEKWFGLAESELDPLAEDGWLLWKDYRYSMHPLVRQIIRLDEVPEGTAEHFLDFVADKNSGYLHEDEIYTERIRRLELADAVLDTVCKGRDTVQVSHIFGNLGWACRQLARYPEAVGYFKRLLTIKEAKRGKGHTDTGAIYNNLGLVYRDMGDLPKALEYLEYNKNALASREAKLEKEDLDLATAYNNLVLVYHDMGDLPKALDYSEKALAIREAKLGKEHPDTATTYNNIGRVYQDMGDQPMALEYYKKALAIREKVLGKEHPYTATTFHNLGSLYYDMERHSDAECYLLQALRVRLVKLGPGHPRTKKSYSSFSNSYQSQHGETESFLPWLRAQLNEAENRALDELLGA